MRVYVVNDAERFELCHPVNKYDFETIDKLVNGEPRKLTWKPLAMRLIKVDQGRKFKESDSPWLESHALIFRPRALEALSDVLAKHGELLPLLCKGADLMMYNVTSVVDALDEAASDLDRFSDGSIMSIPRHVFRPDLIGDLDLFKIPNLLVSPTYASQRFVDLWNSSGLKGLEFEQVWAPN